MKTSIIKTSLILVLVTLSSWKGYSQQTDSLSYYLETAARNNPTVLQRYNEYQAALQKIPQVGSLPDPQLDMGFFLRPMEQLSGNQVAEIRLMQMFPWFGVLKNAKDEMSLMAKANYALFTNAKLQVYYEVLQNWYDLCAVRQKMKISERNIDLLKTIERLSLAKFKSGTSSSTTSSATSGSSGAAASSTSGQAGMNTMGGNGAGNSPRPASPTSMGNSSMGASSTGSGLADVYRVQIESGDVQNDLATLKTEEQVVTARFNTLLNRPLTTSVSVPEQMPAEPLQLKYLTVTDSMLLSNPMLTMLKYEQQSLSARTRMQKQMGLPMVGVGVNYSLINKSSMSTSAMNGQDMIMPMVTMTLPIYRNKYKAMQAESKLLKTASEQNYQATQNALLTEYYEALKLYNDALRQMKLYDSQSQLTQKSLDISMRSFASSATGLTDILLIRKQLLDYETKRIEAITQFNKAKAWIQRLLPDA